ncbi:MAG: PSD1 domain-containing protein [Planctomycetales bacterium]|nr:PSD1 domain-containing protein [Planctomycetales bacterium]
MRTPAAPRPCLRPLEPIRPDLLGARLLGDAVLHACVLGILLAVAPAVADTPLSEPQTQAWRAASQLLQKRCVSCHGAEKQEGGLRLDVGQRVLQGGDSGKAVVAGKPAESLLWQRIASSDDEQRMPPPGEGAPLAEAERELISAWIRAGAPWPHEEPEVSKHWAFQPIAPVAPPETAKLSNPQWPRNPIDQFVLAKLDKHQVSPAPEASRGELIRRVYLDLLGLPPSPEQLREFLADGSPQAYDKMVSRALESPHYGERWGRHWLDLARYADSDGYEKDRPRPNAWRYRSWVIEALNQDLPFDQFTIRQIAGDMLPDAEIVDHVATGFHRNTLHNTEGGTDQEEDRVKKTVDRINTVGTVWLGLTVGCAQCHTHKYDPISQREYYQLYAFFNNIDEKDVSAPTPEQAASHEAALAKHAQEAQRLAEQRDAYVRDGLAAAQASWEPTAAGTPGWETIEPTASKSKHGAKFESQDDGSLLVTGANQVSDRYELTFAAPVDVASVRLEVLPDKRLPKNGPGRADNGNFVLTAFELQQDGAPIGLVAARADFSQNDWEVAKAINDNRDDGWAVSPEIGKRHVAAFQLAEPVPAGATLTVVMDQNYKGQTHNLGRFRLSVSPAATTALDGLPSKVAAALQIDTAKRNEAEAKAVADYYRTIDPQLLKLEKQLADHQQRQPKGPDAVAQAVVERESKRSAHIHRRGNFLDPGDPVQSLGLNVLPPIAARNAEAGPDRLDLAHWLFSPEQPLTARVTVNRIWQRYFGRGLVLSADDFGSQGSPPTHPALLDWLAGEFRDNGWRLKELHRLIVTSATYRQSSQHREELEKLDPENDLLARHPRRRVEAEIVRDLALSVSGLLNPKLGGPSVRPPQPAEYSSLTYANSAKWSVSKDGDQYRRGMYTFFQRTSPYPMLMTFDSPDSTECTARRSESNTPLQALTLWNDVVFFECAQHLARRIVAEAPASDDASRITFALELCLSASGDGELAERLTAVHARHQELCRAAGDEDRKALLGPASLPQAKPDQADRSDQAELAAWVLTGRVLLNLDAFLTKQ